MLILVYITDKQVHMFVFILVTNPEKAQFIHPPIVIMGRTY
jgi:hypothetical protein